ncbi:MAG: exodeoxyribonuclease VII large subunit [Rhodobacteraceae bacterium]|nr:exodeoxyribonuclease VII large subunit [Paracoccaceae bacterium]
MDEIVLDEGPGPGRNAPEMTVSELAGAVRRVIESGFGRVRVRGEVGRVSAPRSGHLYLDLKDATAVLAAVIWKGTAARLATRPEEGMEVIASGRLTTFPGQSKYQLVIEAVEPAGLGALLARLERRKAALAAEGLFDPARKRALPFLPAVIGVVTSPTGAVIRDILHRLRARFPCRVLVWPVAVQGAGAAAEVAAAIGGFNALDPGGPLPRPDVLIVARGGGSVEDLWAFSEEIVVRAAAASAIPLIAAVGHETDTTLIDLAADRRAPTPTAAAEMAVPVRLDLARHLDGLAGRLAHAAAGGVARRRQRLSDRARALPRAETLVAPAAQRLDAAAERLAAGLRAATAAGRLRLARAAAALRPRLLAEGLEGHRRALAELARRAGRGGEGQLRAAALRLAGAAAGLRPLPLSRRIAAARRALAGFAQRAGRAGEERRRALAEALAALDRLRLGLGYQATLGRGYAVVRGDGAVVTTAAAAARAQTLEIEFRDGRLAAPGRARRRRGTGGRGGGEEGADDGQGRLL